MKIYIKRISIVLSAVVLSITSFVALMPLETANAAILDNFNAESIISDSNFTDSKSMSAADIQAFLNRQNSTCLKDYRTLGLYDDDRDGLGDEPYGKGQNVKVSAATLIKQAADLYNISPKVILVTLQKEQGLITRSDCADWRYNTALGYGCPDDEPCDNTAYGFTRQIDYGTWHFKGFFTDTFPVPTKLPGNEYIGYSPVTSCGGKTITIRNRATAALYSYTPYQPNKAALQAGLGEAPCGAYGNRNFFYYYTTWFGSPNSGTDSYLVQCSDGKYLIESVDNRRRLISESVAAQWGLTADDFITMEYGCSFPKFDLGLNQLIRSRNTNDVYYIHSGAAYRVASQQIADGWGLGSIATLPKVEGGTLHQLVDIDKAGMTTVVTSNNPSRADYYLMLEGKRHTIADTPTGDNSVFRMITGDTVIKSRMLPASLLQTVPLDSVVVDYAFRIDSTEYVFDHGKIRQITSPETSDLISSTTTPATLSPKILAYYTDKRTLDDAFARPGIYYKANNNQTLTQTTSPKVIANITSSSPEPVTQLLTTKLKGGAAELTTVNELRGNLRLIQCDDKKYVIERYIPVKREVSGNAITQWGFTNDHFFTGDKGCKYPTYSLGLDSVMRSRTTKKVYYVHGQKAYHVYNKAIADALGLSNHVTATYPQLEGKSINDFLNTAVTSVDNIPLE